MASLDVHEDLLMRAIRSWGQYLTCAYIAIPDQPPTHLPLIARVIEYRELKITYKGQKLWSLHMHSELIACIFYSTNSLEQCVVVHIFNPRTRKAGIFNSSTWEAEPGQGSTNSSPV